MQEQGTLCAYCTFGIHILLQHMLILQWSGTCTSDRGRYCVYAQEHCASSHHIHVPFGWGGSWMFTKGYSYRNCKVVRGLWQGCERVVTRLWEGCYKITNMHLELISHVWLHCKTYCIVGIFHRGCNLHIFHGRVGSTKINMWNLWLVSMYLYRQLCHWNPSLPAFTQFSAKSQSFLE